MNHHNPAGLVDKQYAIDFADIRAIQGDKPVTVEVIRHEPGRQPYPQGMTLHPGTLVIKMALDAVEAVKRTTAGIQAAEKTAGQLWRAQAIRLAEQYLARILTRPFMTEELRAYCYAHGLTKPKSERAWGAITLQLQRSGRIHAHGTAKVRNPKAHKANATTWSTVKPAQQ